MVTYRAHGPAFAASTPIGSSAFVEPQCATHRVDFPLAPIIFSRPRRGLLIANMLVAQAGPIWTRNDWSTMNIKRLIDAVEKLFLALIAGFTVIAMGQEILVLIENRRVALQDLLLMFIYAEVLGMLGAFYARQRNLIILPLFIAMTALSRLIILQGKDSVPMVLLYEAGAILLIAVACWVISRMRSDD